MEILPKFARGEIVPHLQDEATATYTKKFAADDAFVPKELLERAAHGGEDAFYIERKIRALNPEPGVWTIDKNGNRIKLLEAEIFGGKLRLKKIQMEGKRPEIITENKAISYKL